MNRPCEHGKGNNRREKQKRKNMIERISEALIGV